MLPQCIFHRCLIVFHSPGREGKAVTWEDSEPLLPPADTRLRLHLVQLTLRTTWGLAEQLYHKDQEKATSRKVGWAGMPSGMEPTVTHPQERAHRYSARNEGFQTFLEHSQSLGSAMDRWAHNICDIWLWKAAELNFSKSRGLQERLYS